MANFLNRLQTFLFGAAIGRASSDAITPVLEPVRQHSWEQNQVRVLDPSTAAEARAAGVISEADAQSDASKQGYNENRLGVLLRLAQEYPGSGELARMRNRNVITDAEVDEALTRHKIPEKYHDAIKALFKSLLEPADLARAIHRGLIPDPGLLEGELPKKEGNVPAYPVYDIDAIAEALAYGIDRDRLGVLVGLQGNPMGAHEAAQAYFRHILTNDDYLRALAESNTRNEWGEAIREQSRQIPTSRDFLENALRGYRSLQEAIDGAALHGMSEEHATMIYQNQGRPMAVRLITQALARGGKFKPEPGEIKDPYDASIVEGNLKPAYYDLAKSLRYTQPSVFAIRQLAQSGVWNEQKTATKLEYLGWEPADAAEVAKAWTTSGGTSADPHIGKAQTQLWNATHSSYINREASPTVARNKLQQAGVSNAAITQILGLWDAERELIRKGLTPANIKKAYQKGSRNAQTGQPWTRDEALAALVSMGWNVTEANDYLDIP